ncbi:MAG: hypothetical protein JWN05_2604, partial [Arthrobacter sp.]|nr:hypothetical protein [Arthrobacter sp.]
RDIRRRAAVGDGVQRFGATLVLRAGVDSSEREPDLGDQRAPRNRIRAKCAAGRRRTTTGTSAGSPTACSTARTSTTRTNSASPTQPADTVLVLRDTLGEPAKRAVLREALGRVRHVSPKTLDYTDTLSGISTGAAIDVRVHRE